MLLRRSGRCRNFSDSKKRNALIDPLVPISDCDRQALTPPTGKYNVMNDKGLYPGSHTPLNPIKGNAWLTGSPAKERYESHPPHSRLQSTLKRVAWLALAASLVAGLVTWGFHSRFGLLLLLLLR